MTKEEAKLEIERRKWYGVNAVYCADGPRCALMVGNVVIGRANTWWVVINQVNTAMEMERAPQSAWRRAEVFKW